MTNKTCYTPLQSSVFRWTELDECGAPIYDACSYAVSDGFSQIEITANETEGQTFQLANANGRYLVNQKAKTALNWFDFTITMGVKDPELFFLMTGASLFLDYENLAIGNQITEENYATGRGALEIWLGTADAACLPGGQFYGYVLLPFIEDGRLTESYTLANDTITYTLAGRTRKGNQWGTGPYDVMLDASGNPAPLTNAILPNAHYLETVTQLPPPEPDCGCLELNS